MSSNILAERRLELIRGGLPRHTPSVRVLAAYSQHTDCNLATLGFAAGVDFDRLLAGTQFRAPFGQSPFAISRGLAFEKMLRDDQYARTLEVIGGPLHLPPTGVRVVNLREGFPAGPRRMPARVEATADLLRLIVRGDQAAPHLIDGAVLRGTVGGLTAYFEADSLATGTADAAIRVIEVKSFPKVDDRVNPEQLGSALDQAAIYIVLTRAVVATLGGDPERLVSDRAMLITPRNVGLTPTLSEQRVTSRVARILRVLETIPRAQDVAVATPTEITFGPIADTAAEERRRLDGLHDIADRVGTAYTPNCLATCGNARFCRARAAREGSPCLSGPAATRLLPGVANLGRAESLSRGATPTSVEAPAALLLERAGRLIDESTPLAGPAPARRTA